MCVCVCVCASNPISMCVSNLGKCCILYFLFVCILNYDEYLLVGVESLDPILSQRDVPDCSSCWWHRGERSAGDVNFNNITVRHGGAHPSPCNVRIDKHKNVC